MRAHDHPARAAFLVAHFGQRHAVVFLHDAIVVIEYFLGDRGHGTRALDVSLGQFFFGQRPIGFHVRALHALHLLDFL